MPFRVRVPMWFFSAWLIGLLGAPGLSPIPASLAQTRANLVGILISQEIRPFIQMVEGLEKDLDLPACRIFLDEKETPYSQDPRYEAMEPGRFVAMVAVGPRALSFLIQKHWPPPILFGMVLNPERLVPKDVSVCGVSLNLDPVEQFSLIQETFPEVKRIGVLFDPANNQEWFERASVSAGSVQVSLVPLASSNRTDLTSVIRERRAEVDAILFIPDSTVISKALIQHLIKEAFLLGIPAIGYNLFFYESGAALSFVVDYRGVGERVATLVDAVSREGPCVPSGPRFKAVLHRGVARILGLKLASPLPGVVEEN